MPFDVNASFPADARHRPVIEAMVGQAAADAGCAAEVARDLAVEAGDAFVAGADAARAGTPVGVRVDRVADTLEVVVSCGSSVRLTRPVPLVR